MSKISKFFENLEIRFCEKANEILDPNYYFCEKAENYEILEKLQNSRFSTILITLFLIYENIKYKFTNR